MKKNIKNILRLNLKLIKYKPLLFAANFIIWFLISLIPLLSGLIVKQAFYFLPLKQFKNYYVLGISLFLLGCLNGFFIKQGGIIDVATRFYCGQFTRENFISNLIVNKKAKVDSNATIIDILDTDIATLEELISFEIDLLCKIMFFIIALIILFRINPKITIYGMIPLTILSFVIGKLGNLYKNKYKLKRTYNIQYSSLLNEIVNNREAVQFLSDKNNIISNLLNKCHLRKKYAIKNNIFCELISNSILFISNLNICIILFLATKYLRESNLSIGDLTLFISYFGYGFVYLQIFSEVYGNFKYCEDAIIRISNILETEFAETIGILGNKLETKYKYHKDNNDSNVLEFENFKLSNYDIPHNMIFEKNQLISVTGKNGSGKSKFINCIIGYCKFQGNIYYHGDDILKNEFLVNYVPQELHFFNDTIQNNICLFDEKVKFDANSKIANIKNKLGNWNIYSEDFIGVDGKKLSEGQRQRLGIARSFSAKSDLIILDDSLSFLDKDNRNIIINNLIKSKKTIIIATNDQDILNISNKIIYLDKLKIVKYYDKTI